MKSEHKAWAIGGIWFGVALVTFASPVVGMMAVVGAMFATMTIAEDEL